MLIQFDCRRDDKGWTVFDRWTGRVVVLAGARQDGLLWADAENIAERLNRRRKDGDRRIFQ